MIIMPKSCFIHVPKTGGSWVTCALQRSGIPCSDFAPDGNPHQGIMDCPNPEKFIFGFVRNPVDLYLSYWLYKMGAGWDQHNRLDNVCRSDRFDVFLENVLRDFPAVYSNSIEELLGGPEDEPRASFIGKYESLADDLVDGLLVAGESFDEAALRATPPVNVSDRLWFQQPVTKAQKIRIFEAESKMADRFNYSI